MIKKNLKFTLIAYFFTSFLIYGILVVGDYFYHLAQYSKMRVTNDILTKRKKEEDRKYLAELKSLGYEKIIFPYIYYYYPETSKNYVKEIVPISAQPNKNVYYCNEGYGMINFKTDRMGFRNNNSVWDDLKNKKNILFIGDSYTQGACVEENNVISSYFKDFNSINLGLDGNNPYIYANLSKIFIPRIKPKYVIQIFHANDNTELGKIFLKNMEIEDIDKRYFKKDKLEPSDEVLSVIANTGKYIDKNFTKLPGERDSLFKRGSRYLSLPTIRHNLNITLKKRNFKLPYSSVLSIDTLVQLCKKNNCTPIFLYIPVSKYWEDNNPLEKPYMDSLNNFFIENNLVYLDISDKIYKMGKSAFAPKGKHLSPTGYKLVAEEILKKINSLN